MFDLARGVQLSRSMGAIALAPDLHCKPNAATEQAISLTTKGGRIVTSSEVAIKALLILKIAMNTRYNSVSSTSAAGK
jgi:hypothetical protein